MRARIGSLSPLLVALTAVSCSHRVELDPGAAAEIHRLAVVVRILNGPTVDLADHLPAGKTDAALAQSMAGAINTFELTERLRAALISRLPPAPPFASLAPVVQVEQALGSMLVVDRTSGPPNFNDLKPLGVDGVLYLEIAGWGASVDDDKPSLFFEGSARLFTLDGNSTVWREPIEDRGPAGGLTGDWSRPQTVHDLFLELSDTLGNRLAVSLGGGSAGTRPAPSALDTPDVSVEHHEAEKMQTVLPFEYDVDAGAVDAGAPAKSKAPPVDAGDTLFPG